VDPRRARDALPAALLTRALVCAAVASACRGSVASRVQVTSG
jgi:hypothetical protein